MFSYPLLLISFTVCLGALFSQAPQKRVGIVQIGRIKTLCELVVCRLQ